MIAGIVDGLVEMLGHDFMAHAFLAGTGTAIAAGVVGYFVVLRNQVFAADSLGHVAFTGALAALAVGIEPLVGLFALTPAASMAIGALGERVRGRDVVVGTVFAWILGVGVLFLSIYTTSRNTSNGAAGVTVLFGSIFGTSLHQAVVAAAVGTSVVILVLLMSRPLLFASIDPDVAAARGLPVRLLSLAFMALLGIAVGEAVQAVGALLMFGLLVTPAACAQRLTARPFVALAISTTISVGSLWLGLGLSYTLRRVPPSFLVIAVNVTTYAVVIAGTGLRGRLRHRADRSTEPVPGMMAS